MADIIVKPTDQSDPNYATELALYNARITAIRLLASPDISAPITSEEMPETVIADSVYLTAAERRVLRDTAITDISTVSADTLLVLVYMVQVLLAIRLLSQLPELLQESVRSDAARYQEITLDERKQNLIGIYNDELKVLNPSSTGTVGLRIPVDVTGSKYERSLIYDNREFNDYWSYFGL